MTYIRCNDDDNENITYNTRKDSLCIMMIYLANNYYLVD